MREELKAICRAARIDDSGREKAVIADQILGRRPDGTTATLTKADLMEAIAAEAGITKKAAEANVSPALDAMPESLQAGEKIEIRGSGSFGIRQRGARTGRNPKSGVAVHLAPKRISGQDPRLVSATTLK